MTVVFLMAVFPITSVLVEAIFFKSMTGLIFLIGKWFVFWAVGLRLFLAGLRQAITPRFTAEQIFGIKTKEPLIIMQELGFATLSIRLLGISTLFSRTWIMPAAIVGGLFYGLAGVRHVAQQERHRLENIAMLSDLFIFIVLLVYFTWASVNPSAIS